jgi:hypothetical protein
MKGLLAVHVAAGACSFVLAPVALATAKGGKQHKRWGMVYLWAMGVVAATALPMSLYRPVLFLAMVAVFSFYVTFAGYRVLGLEQIHGWCTRLNSSPPPQTIKLFEMGHPGIGYSYDGFALKALTQGASAGALDWTAACVTLVSSLCLVLCGIFWPAVVQHFGVQSVIFGILGMRLAAVQLKSFMRRPTEKMFWWYTHLGYFIASYIAARIAFSVVTLSATYKTAGILLWLWPTIVGVPAIVATTAYYKRKFAPRASTVAHAAG